MQIKPMIILVPSLKLADFLGIDSKYRLDLENSMNQKLKKTHVTKSELPKK